MKNNEETWKSMKQIWRNTTTTMKHTEKKSTQWKASKYIIWSNVTPGSRKYSILSVFVFLSLIKAQRIILNNWKALKNNEPWGKREKTMKNDEKERTNQETIMKNREKQWTMMKKRGKKQWQMMTNREKTMKNDEKERKKEQWWKREEKPMNNDEKI